MAAVSGAPALLWRRLAAELLGSAFLAAVVVGSGIAAQRPVAGRHRAGVAGERGGDRGRAVRDHFDVRPGVGGPFQPGGVVRRRRVRGLRWRDAAAYLPAQVAGCVAGAVAREPDVRHPGRSISTKQRATGAHFLSEVIATLGLLLVIFALARTGRARAPRRRSGPISAPRISSPPRRVSPTRRSPSAGCSPTPSPASPRLRRRRSSPPRSSAVCCARWPSRCCIPRITAAEASEVIVPHHPMPAPANRGARARPRRRLPERRRRRPAAWARFRQPTPAL